MTICGFSIVGRQAFVWADSEVYAPDGEPDDEDVRKLGISKNGIVGVGAGWRRPVETLVAAIEAFEGRSFASAIVAARAVLLDVTARQRAFLAAERLTIDKLSCAAIVICEDGRLRGAVLFEERDFVPLETLFWGNPTIGEAPQSAADVMRIADAQMQEMRQQCPAASGRNLTIAKIGPGGVAASIIPMPKYPSAPRASRSASLSAAARI